MRLPLKPIVPPQQVAGKQEPGQQRRNALKIRSTNQSVIARLFAGKYRYCSLAPRSSKYRPRAFALLIQIKCKAESSNITIICGAVARRVIGRRRNQAGQSRGGVNNNKLRRRSCLSSSKKRRPTAIRFARSQRVAVLSRAVRQHRRNAAAGLHADGRTRCQKFGQRTCG